MIIIKTMSDIERLELEQVIAPALAEHYVGKISKLHEALAPEMDIKTFNLGQHGVFGLLEASDQDMTGIGLPASLNHVSPEWISRAEVGGEVYYIIYIMVDNDYINQIYLPDAVMSAKIRLWLSEQDVEEEAGENDSVPEPPPF